MSKFSSRVDIDLALLKAEIDFLKGQNEALYERVRRLEKHNSPIAIWNAMVSLETRIGEAIKNGTKLWDLLLEHLNLEVVNHPEKTTLEKKSRDKK